MNYGFFRRLRRAWWVTVPSPACRDRGEPGYLEVGPRVRDTIEGCRTPIRLIRPE